MAEDGVIYKLALSFIKGITSEIVKRLAENGITEEDFFSKETRELTRILNLRDPEPFQQYSRDAALFKARDEYQRIKRHNIEVLFLLDDNYPVRLFEISDPPVILYKIGEADISGDHMISVVGTRRPSSYGLNFCESFVKDLSEYFPDLTVVSGLAYGVDACAHMAALNSSVSTVAVMAHGLDMIYPASHRDLAKNILKKGGAIISEYPFGTKPFRQRFLERNRIVAGLSDLTVVVESQVKGGAMSTANFAFSYSRDVMALPGRISDELSSGCNLLIRKQKAHLLTAAPDVIEVTGWQPMGIHLDRKQRNLFPELSGDSKIIYELLRFNDEPCQIDKIHQLSGIPMSRLMSTLGELEFDGIIIKHPGNRYSIA